MSLVLHLESRLLLCKFILLSACWFGLAYSQQNIEIFYPLISTAANSAPPPSIRESRQTPQPAPTSSTSHETVVKAVAATAASSLVVATLFFCAIQRRRRREGPDHGSVGTGRFAPMPRGDFTRFGGNMIKGVIVDENGLDVLYWRRLQGERTASFLQKSLSKAVMRSPRGHEVGNERERRDRDMSFDEHIQELPLLTEKLSSSCEDNGVQIKKERVDEGAISVKGALYPLPPPPSARAAVLMAVEIPRPIQAPPTPPVKPQEPCTFSAVSTAEQRPPPMPAAPPRPPSAVPPRRAPSQPSLPSAAPRPLLQTPVAPLRPPLEASRAPPPPPTPPSKPQKPLTFSAISTAEQPPPPSPPPTPPIKPRMPLTFSAVSTAEPPSRPLPARPRVPSAAPPPPPALPSRPPSTAAPAPPPPPARPSPVAPPPPPPSKLGGLDSSKKPPALRIGLEKQGKQGNPSASPGHVKLKPLHWEKLEANADHSMVWDKVGDGSFRFDDDLMEDLFGFIPGNRNSAREKGTSSGSTSTGKTDSNPSSKIFILDSRKSQNIAIVLKSLGVSRSEILYAITEDQGLSEDVLEKLNKVAPTREEQSQILQFDGDPTRLSDAESYLYYLLKSVPSAFAHFNAMLFRSNFKSDTHQLRKSIRTLELACEELRTRGLFVKLLEAILKAGNRMNAGTSRGNAQAFDLNALRKLSDVKSTDGKTTLLNFVVEQVVRSEGKRCALNRNYSLSRTSSRGSTSSSTGSEDSKPKDERENEYIMLGLPVVGGLSAEFSSVKKAAMIDYDSFASSCTALGRGVSEIRHVADLGASDGSRLGEELRRFIESAEEELSSLREEQKKAMEFVKKTTEYYQSAASRRNGEKPLHLFIVVKDFLSMVDQACVEITRNLQRRKTAMASSAPSLASPKSPAKSPSRFPHLSSNFLLEKFKRSTSSDSDAEF